MKDTRAYIHVCVWRGLTYATFRGHTHDSRGGATWDPCWGPNFGVNDMFLVCVSLKAYKHLTLDLSKYCNQDTSTMLPLCGTHIILQISEQYNLYLTVKTKDLSSLIPHTFHLDAIVNMQK